VLLGGYLSSAFLREVAQRSGLLGEWLMPALMSVAADPEGHVFRRKSTRHIVPIASAPTSCPDSPVSEATDGTDAQDSKADWSETSSVKQDDSDSESVTDSSTRESSDASAAAAAAPEPSKTEDGNGNNLLSSCCTVVHLRFGS
jgi:hypothetical protein